MSSIWVSHGLFSPFLPLIICFALTVLSLLQLVCNMEYSAALIKTRTGPGGFFVWTRFKNLAIKRWKIDDRVAPILVI